MITPKASFPIYIVNDLLSAKDFYTSHLGFNVVFENGWYLHLVTQAGVQLGMMLPDQPTQPEMFHVGFSGQGAIFSLEVADAQQAYDYASAAGLSISLDLKEEAWGQKHFVVTDPNGLRVDIVEAIEVSEEYQAGYQE